MRSPGFLILCITLLAVGAGRPALAQEDDTEAGREAAQNELKRLQTILTRPDTTFANRREMAVLLMMKRKPEANAILLAALENAEVADVPAAVVSAMTEPDPGPPDAVFLPVLFKLAATEKLSPKIAELLPAALAAYRGQGVLTRLLARLDEAPQVGEKVLLIDALGLTGEKDAVAPLIKLLESDDAPVRAAAAKALPKITLTNGFGESYQEWSRWWREHKNESREQWLTRQIENLKAQRLKMDAQLQQQADMLRLLTGRLVEVNQSRLQAMAPNERQAQVLVLLDDVLPELRSLAAAEARKLLAEAKEPDKALIDKLLLRAEDELPAVRGQVARALAAAKDKRAAEALLVRIEKEADDSALVDVMAALGELREPRAVAGLARMLQSGKEPLVIGAAGALAQIGERNTATAGAVAPAIQPMCDLLVGKAEKASSPQVREALARALSIIGGDGILDTLIKAIDDAAPTVRLYAAQGLGNVQKDTPRAVKALLSRLSDADKNVRIAVANALGKLGDGQTSRDISAQLIPTSSEKDPQVRTALWQALIVIQKRETDVKVTEALADEFAAFEDQPSQTGAMQLYEIAVAKFGAGGGNGHLDRLRVKLADAYMRTGQAAKAAEVLDEVLKNVKGPEAVAKVQRKLGEALLQVPPFVKGAELLANLARSSDPALRDELLKQIHDRSRRLQDDEKSAEAYAVLGKAREILSPRWADSADKDRMETLFQTVARALFEQAAAGLRSDDKAVRKRAEDDLARLAKAMPDLLLNRLRAALQANDAQRAKDLEALLPLVREDLSAYQAATAPGEKIKIIGEWLSGGPTPGKAPSAGGTE